MNLTKKLLLAVAVRQVEGSIRDAYNAVRAMSRELGNDNSARMGLDLVTTIIGFIIVFYVAVFSPLDSALGDASSTLSDSLGNSNITGVRNISNLPDVVILLFILLGILGLILAATRSTE